MAPHNITSNSLPQVVALFLFIVSSTIAWGSTSNFSYELFIYARLISVLLFFLIFPIIALKNTRISRVAIFSILIPIYLFLLSLFTALANANPPENIGNMIFNWLMMLALLYLIILYDPKHDAALSVMIIVYGLLVLFITIITDGMALSPAPHFSMEHLSQQENIDYTVTYSQGITKLFGLTAIAAFYAFTSSNSLLKRWWFFSFAIFFLLLSAIGGARGDFVAVLAIVIFTLLKGRGYSLMLVTISVVVGLIVFFSAVIDIQGLALVERFSRIDSASSYRLSLLADALTLLTQSSDCLVFGCGFNYFQNYFGYSLDLHPHNIFIEYIIVFGGVVAFASLALVSFGMYKCHESGRSVGLLSPLLVFFLLIGLKSGTLISSWFAMAYIAYFMGFAFRSKR